MAICFVNGETRKKLNVISYKSEGELEQVVAENPYLLAEDDEPEPVLIAGQVNLPGAGIADLIFLDPSGQITVVEVKLGRNAQSRREVVGQVFDYVSTLADHTLVELDEFTGGGLDRALRSFADAEEGNDYEQLRRTCSTELRAGKVRVSIVVDTASDSLVRIMAFMNEHSDLDVRLIAVQKHERDGIEVFAPQPLVIAREEKSVGRRTRSEVGEALGAAISAFDDHEPHGLTTYQRSRASGYRQIRIPNWPNRYHFEFVDSANGVTAEFHPEDRKSGLPFVPAFQDLKPEVEAALPHCTVQVNATRTKGMGALIVSFPDGATGEDVASGMAKLIEVTRPRLEKEIYAREPAA